MIAEQPTRKALRDLTKAGWKRKRTIGSHSVWVCRDDEHQVTVPDGHKTISAGVLRQISKALESCEQGRRPG